MSISIFLCIVRHSTFERTPPFSSSSISTCCFTFTSLAQSVKLMVSMGVLLGYPLQFFVAIQVMWPSVKQMCNIQGRSLTGELVFRTLLVIVTRK